MDSPIRKDHGIAARIPQTIPRSEITHMRRTAVLTTGSFVIARLFRAFVFSYCGCAETCSNDWSTGTILRFLRKPAPQTHNHDPPSSVPPD